MFQEGWRERLDKRLDLLVGMYRVPILRITPCICSAFAPYTSTRYLQSFLLRTVLPSPLLLFTVIVATVRTCVLLLFLAYGSTTSHPSILPILQLLYTLALKRSTKRPYSSLQMKSQILSKFSFNLLLLSGMFFYTIAVVVVGVLFCVRFADHPR